MVYVFIDNGVVCTVIALFGIGSQGFRAGVLGSGEADMVVAIGFFNSGVVCPEAILYNTSLYRTCDAFDMHMGSSLFQVRIFR
jgi:hypothetical protein